MAWAGSHSQPLTWRKENEENEENVNENVNSQIMRESDNSVKIDCMIEFPPLQNEDKVELDDQIYSFLEDSANKENKDSFLFFEEKDSFLFFEEKKDSSFF